MTVVRVVVLVCLASVATGAQHLQRHPVAETPPDGALRAGIYRNDWEWIGPANVGGHVTSLIAHPTTTNLMFAGTTSGIWKTTTAAASWQVVDSFPQHLAVWTLVLDPVMPSTMYAGTGNTGDGRSGVGVLKSTDGGVTWSLLAATSTTDFQQIHRIAVSPDGSILFVATTRGLLRSTDGGASFTRVLTDLEIDVYDVDFHPTNSQRVLATKAGHVWRSSDGGLTWAQSILAGTPHRVDVTYAPSDGERVYASESVDGGKLYRSVNGGQSFQLVYDDAGEMPLQQLGRRATLLWVHPLNPDVVVWGGVILVRSTDAGATFTQISDWTANNLADPTSPHVGHHMAVPSPGFNGTTNSIVFFANEGGVYRTDDIMTVGDGGAPYQSRWTVLNHGLGIVTLYGGSGHATSGRVIVGADRVGALLYVPNVANPSENWVRVQPGHNTYTAYDSTDEDFFYVAEEFLGLRQFAAGPTEVSTYIGIPEVDRQLAERFAPFVKDPNSDNILLAGTNALWRTTDSKAETPTWDVIKTAESGSTDSITAIVVAPGNSDVIYVGHTSGRIFKTTSGTAAATTVQASWVELTSASALPLGRRVNRITIDPNSVNTIYVLFDGEASDNLYKSTNGGISWTALGGSSGLPPVSYTDLEIHPLNSNWIYLSTAEGIFASENAGATWTVPHDGPLDVPVQELFFLGTTIYAVTQGRGVYRTVTPSVFGPPTISAIGEQRTPLNTPVTVNFTVGDPDTPAQFLTPSATSGNTSVVANAAITFGGSGANRSMTITPVNNAAGTSTISLTVADTLTSTTITFDFVVDPTPDIQSIADQSIVQGTQITVPVTVFDPDTPLNSLVLTGSSSNTTLLPNAALVFGGSGGSRTLTMTPVASQFGASTVTLTIDDGTSTSDESFLLMVTAPPTISAITDRVTTTAVAIGANFTIGDPDTPANSIVLSGSSTNTTLLPNSAITFSGTGTSRSVTMTPAAGQYGTTTVTVVVDDGAATASSSFLLTVLSTPTISAIANQTSIAGAAVSPTFTLTDGDTTLDSLTLSGSSSNTTLLPNASIVFSGSGANRTVTLTPANGQHGTTTVTLTVNDGASSSNREFQLTVTARPTIAAISDQVTSTGVQVSTGVTIGDADSAANSLQLSATSSNTTLLPNAAITFGGTGTSRTIAMTPAGSEFGTTTLTVTVSDGTSSASTSFVLTVRSTPTLSSIANQSTPTNLPISPSFTVADDDTALNSLVVSGTSTNTALLPNAAITFSGSGASRNVTLTPAIGVHGQTTVTLTVSDGFTSSTRSFLFTVTARPTLAAIANHTTTVNGSVTVNFTIGDADTIADTLTLSGSSSNTTLLPDSRITFGGSGTGRSVTLAPALAQFGSTTVTVGVSDGAATTSVNFTLLVLAGPAIASIPAQSTTSGAPVSTDFTIGDPDTADGSLTLSATSTNVALLPVSAIAFGGSGTTRTITLSPVAGQHGSTDVTVTVSDGVQSSSTTFTMSAFATPAIATIENRTTRMNVPVSLGVTVSDADTSPSSLTLSATSSNTTLLPNAAITIGGAGTSRLIGLTPATGEFGATIVTVTISDGFSTSTQSFTLTVTAPPTISPLGAVTSTDGAQVSASFTVGDADSAVDSLTITATSNLTRVLPNTAISITGSGTTRSIVMTPATREFGVATVTVIASDGTASATSTLTVTVVATPTISSVANQVMNVGAVVTTAFTIADFDTPTSGLTVSAASSNATLLPITGITIGEIGGTRSLRLAPAAGQFGVSTVTLTVSDGTRTSSTSFTVTVLAPPTLGPIASQSTVVNVAKTVNFTVADPDTDSGGLTVSGASSNHSLVTTSGITFGGSGATRSVTITPLPGAIGSTDITLTVSDGTQSASITFALTVTPAEPGAIANLAATVSGSTVHFTWTAPASGLPPTGYQLSGSLAPGAPPIVTLMTGSTTPSFTANAPDGQYFVTIRAINSAGMGPIGPEVGFNVGSAAARPGPPNNLTSTVSGNVFTVNWLAPDFGAPLTTYVLEVGTATGRSDLANFAIGSSLSFTTPSVPNGRYFVRLRSRNAAGDSAISREIVVVVGPPPPGAPTMTGSTTPGAVSLSWTAPTTGGAPTSYEIRAGATSGASGIRLSLPASQLSFSTAGVPPGTYFIRVVALNGSGESPPSNEIRLVVP